MSRATTRGRQPAAGAREGRAQAHSIKLRRGKPTGGGGGGGFQDGGLALVGPTTSLQEVRAQLIEAHLDEEEEAEAAEAAEQV